MKINKTSQDVRYKIRKKSVLSLPDNPSEAGMKPDDIKKAFVAPIIDTKDSVLAELDRIVGEANDALGSVDKKIDKVDNTSDRDKPVSTEQQKAIDACVKKVKTAQQSVYTTDTEYESSGRPVAIYEHPNGYSIPKRASGGRLKVGDPTEANDSVNKAYLEKIVELLVGKKGNQTIGGNLSVAGDLYIAGRTYGTDVESLNVKDAVIVANADGIPLAELSGYVIRVGNSQAYGILYDPAEDCVKIGLGSFDGNVFVYGTNEAQVLATRGEINGDHIPIWDSVKHTLIDSGKRLNDLMSKKDFDEYNGNIELALDRIIEIQEALIDQYREESE